MTNLTCDDIRQTLQSGATLLDVRSTDEFNNGALPYAKNIPLAILPLLAHEHLEKDEPVLVYCRVGSRAVMAEKILNNLGYTDITNIGGMHNYQHCS
jgi:phage shock protein E